MTKIDIFLYITLAVIPIIMAVIGAFFVPMPKRYKYAFGIMGLVYILLITIQAFRIYDTTIQAKESNEKLTKEIHNLKQTIIDKNKQIADLTQKQLEVQEKELALNYEPSVELRYGKNRFEVHNKGKTNLFLWGTKFVGKKSIEDQPRMVSPNSAYWLIEDQFEKNALNLLGDSGEIDLPFEIYIKDAIKRKHVARFLLRIKVKDKKITTFTQTLGIERTDW